MMNPMVADARKSVAANQLMRNVYVWMTGALCVTALAAMVVAKNVGLENFQNHSGLIIGLCIAELLLVVALSAMINRMSAVTATLLFLLYSILNGVTLSSILLVYTKESVVGTFFICAGMFASMAIFGSVTKRDLSSIGRFLIMTLFGLIIAMVVNMFLHSSSLYWGITIVGVVLFSALTAYDSQRIQAMLSTMDQVNETTQKMALLGALTLYLDFINLFLQLLRIFGKNN